MARHRPVVRHRESCTAHNKTVFVRWLAVMFFWAIVTASQTCEASASTTKKNKDISTRKEQSWGASQKTDQSGVSTAAIAGPTALSRRGEMTSSTSTLIIIVCTVLLTVLTVGSVLSVVAVCVLLKLLRQDRERHREELCAMLPCSHASVDEHRNALRTARPYAHLGEEEPLLHTVVQHYATGTPAQRLELAHLFATNSVSIAASQQGAVIDVREPGTQSLSTRTPAGTQPVLSSTSHEFGVSTASGADGSGSSHGLSYRESGGIGASTYGGVDSVARGAPLGLSSTTTAPPPASSSAEVSVENTPGHVPQPPLRAHRSPTLLGVPAAAVALQQPREPPPQSISHSQMFVPTRTVDTPTAPAVGASMSLSTRAASAAGAASASVFQPTTAKDEDVLNKTRESRYNLVRRIGDGAFSSVYLVTRKADGRSFAMKYMVCLNSRERAAALRECEIIHSVQGHPGVIEIADMFMSFQFQSSAPPSIAAGMITAASDAGREAPAQPASVSPTLRARNASSVTAAVDGVVPSSAASVPLMLPPPAQRNDAGSDPDGRRRAEREAAVVPASLAAASASQRLSASAHLSPVPSPEESGDHWLAALPEPAAAKAHALLRAAEVARGTVNLTDLFRELALTAATLGREGYPGGGAPPVPIDVDLHDTTAGQPSRPQTGLRVVDADGFILSETDTERLMARARRARQRRGEQSAMPEPPRPPSACPRSVPSPASTEAQWSAGETRARASNSARVTPYADLPPRMASTQHTSSGSNGQQTHGTPLISVAAPSNSAKSSPGLQSRRSSHRSTKQSVNAADVRGVVGVIDGDARQGADTALTHIVDPMTPQHPPTPSTSQQPHAQPPRDALSCSPNLVSDAMTTDLWSPAPATATAATVADVATTQLQPLSQQAAKVPYAPAAMTPAAPTDGHGMPRAPRPTHMNALSDTGSDDSSTGGLAEEPLQPVYRNAMLFAAADATQQRRQTEAVVSGSGGGSGSDGDVDDNDSTRRSLLPWMSEDGSTGLRSATGAAGAVIPTVVPSASSPVRYTGFANYGALQPMPAPRSSHQPTKDTPLHLAQHGLDEEVMRPAAASQMTSSTSAVPPAPMATASYAPMQYRDMMGSAPVHFSNFMSAATSGGALHDLFAGYDDDDADVEDLDASATAAAPVSGETLNQANGFASTVQKATTVAEAIRFARAGLVGECMHTNDGKPHLAPAVLQQLPSYAPVSMHGTAPTSGFHIAPPPQPTSDVAMAPVPLRAAKMPYSYHGCSDNTYAGVNPHHVVGVSRVDETDLLEGLAPSTERVPDGASPAITNTGPLSALKATATATNVTSTVHNAPSSTAAAKRTNSSLLFLGPSGTTSFVHGASASTQTAEETTSSRCTGYSQHSTPQPPRQGSHLLMPASVHPHPHALQGPSLPAISSSTHMRPSPSSELSSAVNAATPATVAARHGGYLCLVMEYHPMGDLSRYALRNQQVLEEAARQHQRRLSLPSGAHTSSSHGVFAAARSVTPPTTMVRGDADGIAMGGSLRGSLPPTPSSPVGPSPLTSNTHSHFFEPRPAVLAPVSAAMDSSLVRAAHTTSANDMPHTVAVAAHGGDSQGKTSTLFTHTRSAGLTGTSATMNSSAQTLSSARSTSLTAVAVTSRDPGHPKIPLPRAVSYEALLIAASADPTALNPLSELQLLSIAYQLASVLRHLHTQNPPIVHRDLKPENILIRGEPRDLLADVTDATASTTHMSSSLHGAHREDAVDGRDTHGQRSVKNKPGTDRVGSGDDPDGVEVINLDAEGPEHEGVSPRYTPTLMRSSSPHSPVSTSSQQTATTKHHSSHNGGDHRTLANTRIVHKIIPIVVTDFGLSMVQEAGPHGKRAGRGGGTRPYIAPEAWKSQTSTASDIWGYGCVLYALATGRLTTRTVRIMSEEARREGFASMILNDILNRRYSLAFASFVVSLLVVDPTKRPTAAMAERCFKVTPDEVRFDPSSPFFSNVLDL